MFSLRTIYLNFTWRRKKWKDEVGFFLGYYSLDGFKIICCFYFFFPVGIFSCQHFKDDYICEVLNWMSFWVRFHSVFCRNTYHLNKITVLLQAKNSLLLLLDIYAYFAVILTTELSPVLAALIICRLTFFHDTSMKYLKRIWFVAVSMLPFPYMFSNALYFVIRSIWPSEH